jgi:hypothetical protein
MNWPPWRRRHTEADPNIDHAERRAAELSRRADQVARDLQRRAERNHFADQIRAAMGVPNK